MSNTKTIVDFNDPEIKRQSDEFWKEFYKSNEKQPMLTDEEIAEDFSDVYEDWEYETPPEYKGLGQKSISNSTFKVIDDGDGFGGNTLEILSTQNEDLQELQEEMEKIRESQDSFEKWLVTN